jgi:hypothetical protein
MLEFLQRFEQTAGQYEPLYLIIPGIVCVLAGLFLWIGGLGFRKPLAIILGMLAGAAAGFFFGRKDLLSAAVAAPLGGFLALLFERIFTIIIGIILAAVIAIFILSDSASITSTDLVGQLKDIIHQMPNLHWLIIGACGLAALVLGLLLWHLLSALCCSILGSAMIFAGMILLLLFKGSKPISSISTNYSFYGTVFLVMTGFGTIVQLLLCSFGKKKSSKKTKDDKKEEHNENDPARRHNWRTS